MLIHGPWDRLLTVPHIFPNKLQIPILVILDMCIIVRKLPPVNNQGQVVSLLEFKAYPCERLMKSPTGHLEVELLKTPLFYENQNFKI